MGEMSLNKGTASVTLVYRIPKGMTLKIRSERVSAS